jgi:tetratricopeptide (TPR) repeat protein
LKVIFLIIFFFYNSEAYAFEEIYKLLKVRNVFKIEDYKTISEITKKEYQMLPMVSLRRAFLSKDKQKGDTVDEYLKGKEKWEHVVFFNSLDDAELLKSDLDSVRFLRAKRFFSQGKYQEAIKEIRSMNKSSPVYGRSLYLLGLMFLYNNQFDASKDAFAGCIRLIKKLNENESGIEREMNLFIIDKCQIANSRVLFKEKKFEEAKESYKKIPLESYQWPESVLELSWIYYLEDKYPKSFARNLTLENKSFFKFMYIENRLLAVLNLQKSCFYKQALDLTTKTVEEYNLVLKDLSKYTKLEKENRWKLFEQDILETPFILLRKDMVSKIDKDLKKLKKLPPTIVKDTFDQELRKIRRTLVSDMNDYVKKLIKRKYLSISRNVEDLLAVKLSIINKMKVKEAKTGKVKRESQKGKVKWQFNNEYWPDELEDVSVNLGNKCT